MQYYLNQIIFFSIFLLLIINCASQGPASGGPKDLDGPKLISIEPKSESVNIPLDTRFGFTFDELIDPLSIPSAIKINNDIDYKLKIRGNQFFIIPKNTLNTETSIRIDISRTLRDYKGNEMDDPLSAIYSTGNIIPKGFISGSLENYLPEAYYNIGLYHYPFNDTIPPVLIVESGLNGDFIFNNVKGGKYTVIALENKINNIISQINENRYGIIPTDFIILEENNSVSNIYIYMDEHIERLNVKSIEFKNSQFAKLNYSNNSYENYIISINKNSPVPGDTLEIQMDKENRLEKYKTSIFKSIIPIIIDSIPPEIISTDIIDNNFIINFSEPIYSLNIDSTLSNNYKIIGYNEQDSINLDSYLKNPMEISIMNANKYNKIEIFNNNIIDYSGNLLNDSITIIDDLNYLNNSNLMEIFESSLGSLKGNISYNGSNSIVVSVINLDNKSIHNKIFENNKYEFNSLASGQYIIWCYESLNTLNKDVYFSGTLSPYKRAARFGFYPDTIEVRARWLIEEVNLEIK